MTLDDLLAAPMRLMQDSDAVLEVENRPIRRAAITAGGILLAVAMGLAAIADGAVGTGITVLAMTALIGWFVLGDTVQLTQLRLDRPAGQARLRVTTLRGRMEETLPLPGLERAELRTRYGATAGNDVPQLYLIGKIDGAAHEILVPMGRADTEEVARMAAVITAWLSRTMPGGQA